MRSVHEWVVQSRLQWRSGRHKACAGLGSAAIALVHFADKYSARAGDSVSFTAWILNDSDEPVKGVQLIQRSLTNGNSETLAYTTEPSKWDLYIPHLAPGESTQLRFTYVVQHSDVIHGGEIISAMEVRATSSNGPLADECEAVVHVRGSHKGAWSR